MSIFQLTKQGHELETWDDGAQWFVEVRGEEKVYMPNWGPFASEDEAYHGGRQYFRKNIVPELDGQIPLVRCRKPKNDWESEESQVEGYAYHEAGHALLYHLFGRRVTLVTIKSQDTDLPGWGDGQTKSQSGEKEFFLDNSESGISDEIKRLETEVAFKMAGFAAEALAFGWSFDDKPENQGDDNPYGDWEYIEPKLKEIVTLYTNQHIGTDKDAVARRIFDKVTKLLITEWDMVERLAVYLQKYGTIRENDVELILTGS